MTVESELIETLANELNNSSWSFGGLEVASAVADVGGISIVMTDGSTWAVSVAPTSDAHSFEPDLVWDSSEFESQEEQDEEWDFLCERLTEFMEKVNSNGHWHAVVNNFGWRHQDGTADIVAHNGLDLLRGVLPRTECTFKIWLNEKEKKVTIDNAHHDAPTGGEMYYVTPKEDS